MIVLNSKIKSFNLKDDRFIHHLFDKLNASKKKIHTKRNDKTNFKPSNERNHSI